MKRILFSATLALALSGSLLLAQQPQPAPQQDSARVEHHHGHHARDPHKAALKMTQKLNLSADQTARIEPILAAQQQKVAAIEANSALDAKGRKQQMHAIRHDTMQQISGILTPEQAEKMKSMHHGHHGEHGEHSNAPAPAA